MRAAGKEDVLDWAQRKMLDLARVGDREGIERVYRWATARVRGSNQRKWTLADARERALRALEG